MSKVRNSSRPQPKLQVAEHAPATSRRKATERRRPDSSFKSGTSNPHNNKLEAKLAKGSVAQVPQGNVFKGSMTVSDRLPASAWEKLPPGKLSVASGSEASRYTLDVRLDHGDIRNAAAVVSANAGKTLFGSQAELVKYAVEKLNFSVGSVSRFSELKLGEGYGHHSSGAANV
jgi:hypothetical protein